MEYILNDSGVKAIFVSSAAQARRIAEIRSQVPGLQWVIGFDATKADGCDMTLAELEALGAKQDSPEAAARFKADALAIEPGHLITLIYTSGTTGKPKGVMLTHDNVYSNCMATQQSIPLAGGDVALSFLPLSHIFERMGDYYLFANGVVIAYAESIDTVPINMQEVRPTLMMSVPRLYEKMYARVLENAVRQAGSRRASSSGRAPWASGGPTRSWPGASRAACSPSQYAVAQKLVFSKLKERTGGRLRFFVSGGAPLSPQINKFFYSAGLTILEGYGLTETSPVISANTVEDFRIGTVGKPIRGVEVRIASDGEILTRGPHVMKGYYKNPEATAEAIDARGVVPHRRHRRDRGRLPPDHRPQEGHHRDRRRQEHRAAADREHDPRRTSTSSQAVMIGDKRKYAVVLIVPNWDQLEKWCAEQNIVWTSRAELLRMPTVQAKMEKEVKSELTGLAQLRDAQEDRAARA